MLGGICKALNADCKSSAQPSLSLSFAGKSFNTRLRVCESVGAAGAGAAARGAAGVLAGADAAGAAGFEMAGFALAGSAAGGSALSEKLAQPPVSEINASRAKRLRLSTLTQLS